MQPSAPALACGLPVRGSAGVDGGRCQSSRRASGIGGWGSSRLPGVRRCCRAEALAAGSGAAAAAAWHALLIDYLPFVTLLLALYTAGGGILLRGGLAGTPAGNTAMLAMGMVLGLVMGTTGASMVLIHPLLRANAHRTPQGASGAVPHRAGRQCVGRTDAAWQPAALYRPAARRAVLLAGAAPAGAAAGRGRACCWPPSTCSTATLPPSEPPAPRAGALSHPRLGEHRADPGRGR